MTSTSSPLTTALPDLPAQTGEATLIGYGRIHWGQLTGLLADAEAAWADYSGFHIGPVPAEAPPYSHLWAWTKGWLARARIDNGTAITGILVLSRAPSSGLAAMCRETVKYQHAQAATWSPTEKRVGRLPGDIAGRPMDLYVISGGHPITFVTAERTPNAP